MLATWTPKARADLLAVHDFVAAQRPRAAAALVETIAGSAEMLARHPGLGRPGRLSGTRELVISGTPYVIVYRVAKDRVELLAVLHASRQFPIMEP